MSALRPDAHAAAPDWAAVLPTHPDGSPAEVSRTELVKSTFAALRDAACTGQDVRIPLVALAASSGMGKSHLLQLLARSRVGGFSECAFDDPALASWAASVVFFGINFSSSFNITERKVGLLRKGLLDVKHLTALRLIFLELADLSEPNQTFRGFIKRTKRALRSGSLSKKLIRREARALVKERAGRGPCHAPVVLLVDEPAKVMSLPIGIELVDALAARARPSSERLAGCAVVSLLMEAATALSTRACGVKMTSTLDYRTAAEAATLSGRTVRPEADLFCAHPEDLESILYGGLTSLAQQGFMIMRDAHSYASMYASLKTDLFVARQSGGLSVTLSETTRLELHVAAAGLSYLSGGHVRTAVHLGKKLAEAGTLFSARQDKISITSLLGAVDMVASSEAALQTWDTAESEDVEEVLSSVLLGNTVSGSQLVFSSTRRGASPGTSARTPDTWDEARKWSVVLGSGKRFVPRIPPLVLFQLLSTSGVQLGRLYAPLKALLSQTELQPDQRWEQAGCVLEWLRSCCRSLAPRGVYDSITLLDLFHGDQAAFAGNGALLQRIFVDASHPRTAVAVADIQVLLSWAADGDGDGRRVLDKVYRLQPNMCGLDAIYFFRVAACPVALSLVGEVIMVGVQFKYSGVSSSTTVYPKDVFRDWDNLPGAFGNSLWEEWRSRFVYVNLADRLAGAFRDKFSIRKNKPVPQGCAEQSIVIGRQAVEGAFGPSAYHFVRSMDWLYKCQVSGL